ncbi:hypothetical protein BV898_08671 [Hypsibius exemplaris]|uniref:Uncharacterized protein n=1 Tax=Hypsibius exemplaris TaxID=2072580 RepID=A0A1W0WQ44_HYPEX|nr:hypothetical protein BV898_08671 [Hypsibius exemplaris]
MPSTSSSGPPIVPVNTRGQKRKASDSKIVKRKGAQKMSSGEITGGDLVGDEPNLVETAGVERKKKQGRLGQSISVLTGKRARYRPKNPTRRPGRPPNPKVKLDLESGAVHNFFGPAFTIKRSKRFGKGKAISSASFVWLSFWTDEEKRQLIEAVTAHGADCDPNVLLKFIPTRSIQDVKGFMALLRTNGRKVVLSAEYSLSCGMSAADVMRCRDPFVRIPVGSMAAVTGPFHDTMKQAFLDAVETEEFTNEIVDPGTLDFDRIYRLLAHCLLPDTTVASLRETCSRHDLILLRDLLSRLSDIVSGAIDRQDELATVLRSRQLLQTTGAPPFTTEVPPGDAGPAAQAIACLPEGNPLRLRPVDLMLSEGMAPAGILAPPEEQVHREVAPPLDESFDLEMSDQN